MCDVVTKCCNCAALNVPQEADLQASATASNAHVDASWSVRMLTSGSHDPGAGLEIELILDSGADASCLPFDFCEVGQPALDKLESTLFTDAQGNRLSVHSRRKAVLSFPDSVFTETFLVSNVGTPTLAVGKLYRAGFGIFHESGEMFLGNEMVQIPVYLKNNSLATKCHIRMVCVEPSLQGSQVPARKPLQPDCGNVQCSAARAVQCMIDGLGDLQDHFNQIKPDVFALRCFTTHHVDVAMSMPHEGCEYRSTLVKYPDGTWVLLEWCETIANMMECSAALPLPEVEGYVAGEAQEIIVLASRGIIAPEDVGLEVLGKPPAVSEPQESLESEGELMEVAIQPDDPGQVAVEVALRDEPDDGGVVVDGVTLSMDSSLATLRHGAQSLGLGRSGGKATVLKRIRDHLTKQSLIAAHRARQEV